MKPPGRVILAVAAFALFAVIALAGYVAWFMRAAVTDTTRVVATLQGVAPRAVDVRLVATGGGRDVAVTEITVPRTLRDELGLGAPAGFRIEPLPLERGQQEDKEAVDFVAKFNRETVRYVGRLPLRIDTAVVISFPAEHARVPDEPISFRYEHKVGLGGAIGFARLAVPKP